MKAGRDHHPLNATSSADLDCSVPALGKLRLAVAGGGVLGLSVAASAVRAGARVTVFEPRLLGRNASGVAAGMLAPVLEAAVDGAGPADHALFREAYEAWPIFAARVGIALPDHAAGALYTGPPDVLDHVAACIAALNAKVERLTAAQARALQPSISPNAEGALRIAQDGRLDPLAALSDLRACILAGGGEIVEAPCPSPTGFDATVIAAGYEARRWADRVSALRALQPIKGHVLHFRGGPDAGPTVRGEAGYLAPQRRGAVFGATMEPGCSDEAVDPSTVRALHAAALRLAPGLAETPFTALTGVRAALPDGRPLAGHAGEGLHLAVGGRRNGWLLAPLVAAAVLEGLRGGAPHPAFDPQRMTTA